MDLDLKHSRDHHSHPTPPTASSELPLFVSQPNTLFAPHHSTTIPRMGGYFSLSQWQELELQALVFRHMTAGADVPPELLHLVKKSLITTSPFYPSQQHYYPNLQQSFLQSGYWGRAAMDPEPGRCRRTDGKKWRCSRDVVTGQKYCERHMHRGKNRSRKHVETPTSAASPYGGASGTGGSGGGGPPQFTLSMPSHSTDLPHLNQRPISDSMIRAKGPFDAPNDGQSDRTLRHFFDDWPKPLHERDNGSATSLSLKLGTGDGDETNMVTWETNMVVAPMGGPLAEVLRSSANNSSPTSVLHRMARASEGSY